MTAVIARVAGPLDTARSMSPRPQFGNHLAQRLRIARCIVSLEGNVFALDIAARAHSFTEAVEEGIGLGFRETQRMR